MHYEELINTLQNYGKDPSRLIFEDELTGISNRRFLLNYLDYKVDWQALTDRPISLLMMDLDRFKHINDSYGHESGDQALIFVACLLKDVAGDEGIPIRYAGDEFMILLPQGEKSMALQVGERLLQRVHKECLTLDGGKVVLHLTLSIGVASAPGDARHGKDLIHKADTALYHAKQAGRDRLADAGNIVLQEVFGKATLRQLHGVDIVGRRAQLEQVTAACEQFSQGQSQFLLIEGAAGMGKTTFLDTMQHNLAKSDVTLVKVNGISQEGHRPYYLMSNVLVALLKRLPNQGTKIFESLRPDEFSYLTTSLLQLDKADGWQVEAADSTSRQAIFNTLVDFIPQILDAQPLMVLVDDLQFVDEATLLLFRALMLHQEMPLFICGTTSDSTAPNADEQGGPLEPFCAAYHEELHINKIRLNPLTATDIAAHLRGLFPQVSVPKGFEQNLAEITQGNPLFLGEILRKLLMDQKITLSGQQWVIQPLEEGYLPDSLEEIVHQKLSTLDDEGRQLLAHASIFGEDVSLSFLTGSSDQMEAKVLEFVDQAVELGLIRTDFELNDETIRFLGKRILEITYGRMAQDRKQVLHERVGQYQERLYERHLLPAASYVAYHYKRSANSAKARTYEQLQAAHSAMVFNPQEAASYRGEAAPDVPLAPETLPLVRDVIRSLQTAIRYSRYYPPENKAIQTANLQLTQAINRVLENNARLSLVQKQQVLLVNGQQIAVDEYRAVAEDFILLLCRAGLRGITFLSGLQEQELKALLEAIAHIDVETIDQRFWERFSKETALTHIDLKQVRYTERVAGGAPSHVIAQKQQFEREDTPLVHAIIRSLLGATRNIKLYPINSRMTSKSIHQLEEALHSFLSKSPSLTLAWANDSLLVNGERIDTTEFRSLANGFLRFLNSMQVGSLTFLESISLQELETFIGALNQFPETELHSESWKHFAKDQGISSILFDEFQYEIGVAATLQQSWTANAGEDLLTHCENEGNAVVEACVAVKSAEQGNTQEPFEACLKLLPECINDLLLNGRTDEMQKIVGWLFEDYQSRDSQTRENVLEACKNALQSVPTGFQQSLAKLLVDPLLQAISEEQHAKLFGETAGILHRIALGLLQFSEYLPASKIFANLRRHHQQLETAGDARAWPLARILKGALDRATQNLLVEDLKSGHPARQQNAAQLLSSLGWASLPSLIDIIKQDNELRVRQHAASILVQLGPTATKILKREMVLEIPPEECVRIIEVIDTVTRNLKTELACILTEKDPRVRQAAFRLADRLNNKETVDVLLSLASHQETGLAVEAIKCLGRLTVAGITTVLVTVLTSAKDPARVLACCQVLGQIGDPVSIDPLARVLAATKLLFLRKWTPKIRAAAAFALGQVAHPQALEVLASFADDRNSKVRRVVRAQLGRSESSSSQLQ
jgi:diguanylate cyclase (GGDEF)-like protein